MGLDSSSSRERLLSSFSVSGRQLVLNLESARSELDHAGSKGDRAERAFREFLRSHLSRRIDIGSGEIIDTFDNRSQQSDVILLNENNPFYFPDQPGLYLIEGVSVVGEVKTVFGTTELNDSIKKSVSHHSLIPVYRDWFGNLIDNVKYPPFFIFAYSTKLGSAKIMEKLLQTDNKINALFLLDKGVFLNFSNSSLFKINDDLPPDSEGWIWIKEPNQVLVILMLWIQAYCSATPNLHPPLCEYLFPLQGGMIHYRVKFPGDIQPNFFRYEGDNLD